MRWVVRVLTKFNEGADTHWYYVDRNHPATDFTRLQRDALIYVNKNQAKAKLYSLMAQGYPAHCVVLCRLEEKKPHLSRTLLERVADVQLEIRDLDRELQVRSNSKIHYALRGTIDFLESIRQGLIEEAK